MYYGVIMFFVHRYFVHRFLFSVILFNNLYYLILCYLALYTRICQYSFQSMQHVSTSDKRLVIVQDIGWQLLATKDKYLYMFKH